MPTTTKKPAIKPLLDLTAADLMTTPVMTIPQAMSLQEAARLLSGASISGAPVVDETGRCVGVLSSSDFVTCTAKGEETEKPRKTTHFIAPWGELIDLDGIPENAIGQYMTAQPVAVAPTAAIGELAQKMVDAHIHRLLVVTDKDRPCGIVSSTDVLAALARAAQQTPAKRKSTSR